MIVGIDLGTTNSLISVWEAGAARLIPNGLGELLTPSCVSIDGDGSILVGRAARERLQTHPDMSAAAFKRHMGSDKVIKLGQRSFRPEELSALILRALKEDAEAALGQAITECIITVPAYFSDAQRKATRAAGQLAGMRVDRLLNEPTAAALAYGIHQRDSESRFLVFDLGGGTFDVSVLDLFDNVMEVRASAGDNFLGGEDFVACLVERFFEHAGLPAALKTDARFLQRLSAQAEQAKRTLSEQAQASIRISEAGVDYSMDLSEAMFEKWSTSLLRRLRDPVERALRDAGMAVDGLDSIVLAGGATRMPLVRRMVARMFGRLPSCDINPDQVVALGAAVQAGLRSQGAALEDVVMTDVSPYSLGVETSLQFDANAFSYGHFDPIIERNCVVPASRIKRYYPLQDDQRGLEFNIYQGEARMAAENIKLGQLHVDLPGGAVGDNGVDLRFTYDVNGLLQVEATIAATGETKAILIEGNPGLLSEQEIAERFAALSVLKIHPRERLEIRTLVARGERVYQQLRGAAREALGAEMLHFERLLETQDPRQFLPGAKALLSVLDDIEQQAVLAPMSTIDD
ncbi:MAG: molecular chaperone HscC [Pseudomonadota bacterium]